MTEQDAEPILVATDKDDPSLMEVRRTLVEPVVASLLTSAELEDLMVCATRTGKQGVHEVWVRLQAQGESFTDRVDSTSWATGRAASSLAQRLSDHLQDWISETRFGWGQQRPTGYTLPTP